LTNLIIIVYVTDSATQSASPPSKNLPWARVIYLSVASATKKQNKIPYSVKAHTN